MSNLVIFALAVAALLVLSFAPRAFPRLAEQRTALNAARVFLALVGLGFLLEDSVVSVPANQVGIVRRIYGNSNLPENRLIATEGENGYQADIIAPGTFRISPFFNLINSVDLLPVVVVPQGFYGRIVARDGASIAADQVMADAWPDAEFGKYLDAGYFLRHGGQKGLQLSILKPGTYPLNLALFEVRIGFERNGRDIVKNTDVIYDIHGVREEDTPLNTGITRVPAGSVGVVRSSVQVKGRDCSPTTARTDDDGLKAELVPEGCKGVWSRSLPPNDYYLNRDAYDVTLVSTRVTTLDFNGGFTRRYIDLKVDGKGDFTQTERSETLPVPADAADAAVKTKVEGWEIPQELRAVVQITPEHAPIVVAAVGGQSEVDKRIVVPAIRSHVRNVYGGQIRINERDGSGAVTNSYDRPTKVLDTVENRTALESAILEQAQVDGRRAGVDVKEIRLGESAIPPELLLARQRQQLAGQLKQAYEQEEIAQQQRQKAEFARSTADQQKDLVTAQIGVQTARLEQDKRQAEGHAERLYLEEQAAGQTAQANVLGKDNVLKLQVLNSLLSTIGQHPDILRGIALPRVYVSGGGGMDSAAGILGSFLERSAGAESQPQPAPAR